MTVGSDTLYFTDATVTYNNTVYYYVKNLQGDVVAILDTDGDAVVEYSYDAWGNILTTTGTMASTLGEVNPLTYRGYVYDTETGLYYLQSRYYDPEVGRFLNADAFASTGQGILGNNMFAYCLNTPVNGCDPCGTCFHRWDFWNDCEECGGATLGDKMSDAKNKIIYHNHQQAKTQYDIFNAQNRLVGSAVNTHYTAYVDRIDQQFEQQCQDYITRADFAEYLIEHPRAGSDVGFGSFSIVTSGIGLIPAILTGAGLSIFVGGVGLLGGILSFAWVVDDYIHARSEGDVSSEN